MLATSQMFVARWVDSKSHPPGWELMENGWELGIFIKAMAKSKLRCTVPLDFISGVALWCGAYPEMTEN